MTVEEKIVGALRQAIEGIEYAESQMQHPLDQEAYKKRLERLARAKRQVNKVLKKNYKCYL